MLGLVVAVAGLTVAAGPAAAATTVAVDAGYDGYYVPGRSLPVRVTITTDRLVAAQLEVGIKGTAPVTTGVEVPGGSQKQYLVVIPTQVSVAVVEVAARLSGSGAPTTAGSGSVRPVLDVELVGLLPGALAGRAVPGPAPLTVDVGTARFVALSEADLARAPESLGPLGTLGVGADELNRLAPGPRAGVLRWVESGGRLLVDAPAGATVAGLPPSWQPGPGGRVAAGRGEVRLTGGSLAGGRWRVEPTGWAANAGDMPAPEEMAGTLASDAGFRVPRLAWLIGFLVAYVGVVGPGLYILLKRRRRQELAWVAIPLVAILFSAGAYVAGRGTRSATQLVHATILRTGESGNVATSYLGATSRSGETVRLSVPAGWLPVPSNGFDIGLGASLATIRQTPGGIEADMPLDAGQFGVAGLTGPAPEEGRLEVTASSGANGRASGTVRNGTPHRLESVAVFVGQGGVLVGTLEPGAQRDWQVADAGPAHQALGLPPAAWQLWGDPSTDEVFFGDVASFRRDQLVDPNLWGAVLNRGSGQPWGTALAAGWTRDFTPPVRARGSGNGPSGRTLVLGQGPTTVAGPALTDVSVQATLIRGGAGGGQGFRGTTTVRLALPAGATPDARRLRASFPAPIGEVWNGTSWVQQECAQCGSVPNIKGGGITTINGIPVPATIALACPPGVTCPFPGIGFESELPAGAIQDGAIYIRVSGYYDVSGFGLRQAA